MHVIAVDDERLPLEDLQEVPERTGFLRLQQPYRRA